MTKEQLLQWPAEYRDLMMVLKPVVDTRGRDAVLHINGIPFAMIYSAISSKYGYSPEQVRELANNLRRQGYVEADKFGFFVPTGKGEQLLRLLSDDQPIPSVPPLPEVG